MFGTTVRGRWCILLLPLAAPPAAAQGDASLTGTVRDAATARPLAGISITTGSGRATVSDAAGRYRLLGLPAGEQPVRFRWLGYAPRNETVTLRAGEARVLDVTLTANPVLLGLVRVSGPSRVPERVVDAPAAVVAVEPARVRDLAGSGQVPMLVADLTGARAAQAGLLDFNLNTRGFNTPLNRRTLVLIDGRDVSIPMLGNQEWADLSVLEDATQVELVRGPGAALYGANAFSGVLAITTPAVRETPGTRVSVTSGELGTLKVDARQSWLSGDQRWGVRASAGHQQSRTWDRARTNLGDLESEYEEAALDVSAPFPGYELAPLRGQAKAGAFGLPGEASGTPEPATVRFGALRVDRYRRDGSAVTLEGGLSRVENTVITTGAGRSQIANADRPWVRAAWTGERFSLLAYHTARDGDQTALASATQGLDRGATSHLEAQRHWDVADARGRWVVGASLRNISVDSRGTVLDAREDGRNDGVYAVFQQFDWALSPRLKAIVGARIDGGSMFDPQFSPKLGLLFTPRDDQAIRLTFNRGYLAPSAFQRFLRFPAGAPVDLSALEAGLRASPLGPALAGVPNGELFTVSAAVPLYALGNADLKPEVVTGYELGYKGQLGRLFVSVDLYTSTIVDFATSILPGTNPRYPFWTAPVEVPEPARAGLESAVLGAVGGALSRTEDGASAFVLSFGNAGRATERGAELGLGLQATDRLRLDANYTWYDADIDQGRFAPGDTIRPNAPPHQANLAATWQRPDGWRLRGGLRFTDAYAARVGTWTGALPSATAIDLHAAMPLGTTMSLALSATNLLDQRRVHVLGGSRIERRVLATLTWRR